jgi:hypothetical protein
LSSNEFGEFIKDPMKIYQKVNSTYKLAWTRNEETVYEEESKLYEVQKVFKKSFL